MAEQYLIYADEPGDGKYVSSSIFKIVIFNNHNVRFYYSSSCFMKYLKQIDGYTFFKKYEKCIPWEVDEDEAAFTIKDFPEHVKDIIVNQAMVANL